MQKELTAPAIDNYIDWMSSRNHRTFSQTISYDEKTYSLLDEIFAMLKRIVPTKDDCLWELWISAKRGPVSDFANVDDEEDQNYYGFKNEMELEKIWKDYYPSETKWYHFCAVEHDDRQYRSISLAHKHVIVVDKRRTEPCNEYEVADFAAWILQVLKKAVRELEAGRYNERIRKSLPPEMKTGTIRRKEYFDLFPEYRESFFDGLKQSEIDAFIQYAKDEPIRSEHTVGHMPSMTANTFFNACAIGYKANNHKDCTLSAIEQYKHNADGRDEGLTEIDADSPEAFDQWYHSDCGGGHPWEIFRGGNSTHISLYVCEDEGGYYYVLSGDSEGRCIETIRMYLALRRNGIFVYLPGAKLLIERLLETEKIGIVPDGIFPRYCESLFPKEDIRCFMNLPYEKEEKERMLPYCVWQEPAEIMLVVKNENV